MIGTKPESGAGRGGTRDMQARAALALLMALSYLFLSYKSADPMGGYHAFNEGWYSYIAVNYDSVRSFLFPTIYTGRVDYNVSPLLSYLLYFTGSATGWQEWSLRIVPIIFSVMTLPALYALGRRFWGRFAGLAAAAMFAFTPVNSIVGRNVQTDALYVCLMMWALAAYLKAEDAGANRVLWGFVAGLLFGASFMSKQFVVLLPPAVFVWETARSRGFKWIGWKHAAAGAGAALVVAPFMGYHFLNHSNLIFGSQGSVLASGRLKSLGLEAFSLLGTEIIWGLSPLIAFAAVAGAVWVAAKKNAGGWLCVFAIAVFLAFFAVWHGHSYYMLFMTPFCCLIAGAALGAMKRRVAAVALAGAAVAVAFAVSVLLLCAVKYGYDELHTFSRIIDEMDGSVIVATNSLTGSYYPLLRYYNRDVTTVTSKELAQLGVEKVNFGRDKHAVIVGLAGIDDMGMPPLRAIIKRRQYAPVIAGRAFFVRATSEHFFNIEELVVVKAGGARDWGLRELGSAPSLIVGFAPQGADIPIVGDDVDFGLRPRKPEAGNGTR